MILNETVVILFALEGDGDGEGAGAAPVEAVVVVVTASVAPVVVVVVISAAGSVVVEAAGVDSVLVDPSSTLVDAAVVAVVVAGAAVCNAAKQVLNSLAVVDSVGQHASKAACVSSSKVGIIDMIEPEINGSKSMPFCAVSTSPQVHGSFKNIVSRSTHLKAVQVASSVPSGQHFSSIAVTKSVKGAWRSKSPEVMPVKMQVINC